MILRLMAAAIFVTIAFVSFSTLAPTPALAAKCGGLNQKACPPLKKGPECNKWLMKVKKICRPCGALNQRACPPLKKGPVCKPWLMKVKKVCKPCGGLNQKACPVLAQGKTCKPGLRRKAGRCVKDDSKRAILAKAKKSAQKLRPLLRSLGNAVKKISNGRTIKEIQQAFKDKRPDKITLILAKARTRATANALKKAGFRSLTLGISSAAGLAVGYARETGGVTNVDGTTPAKLYVSKTWSGGIQLGVGNDLVLSAYTANPGRIAGKSWAAIGNFDVGSGLGVVLYYDKRSLLITGVSVGVGIGSVGAGGAVGEATTTICPARACDRL